MNLLQPPTVKVVAALCVVRNSLGENGFVTDEIITAKSGQRIRIVNADIEGRLCIADALFHIKEMALCSVNPHIFTIATVMAGAKQAVGSGYSVSNLVYSFTSTIIYFIYFFFPFYLIQFSTSPYVFIIPFNYN